MPAYIPQVLYGAGPPTLIEGLRPTDIYIQTDTGLSTGTPVAEFEFQFAPDRWVQVALRAQLVSWTNATW